MALSIFSLFKIGLGPSSSHTVGPMKAALMFTELLEKKYPKKVTRLVVELYGSLALTGIGHGTDKAILLGLEGEHPTTCDPDTVEERVAFIREKKEITLKGGKTIHFDQKTDLIFFRRKFLPFHPNGMTFKAFYDDQEFFSHTYYSVGGGYVVSEDEAKKDELPQEKITLPYPFSSGNELLQLCKNNNKTIAEIMLLNECVWLPKEEVYAKLDEIWLAMLSCIQRGCKKKGVLPGKLKVKRRASAIYDQLTANPEPAVQDPLVALDWVNLYAMAVNEENASGARVVTAPTNGAAGVVPAVIRYYQRFCHGSDQEGVRRFLLTSGAIGLLYVQNASISGAEVGCQGEVGVACSMAAGGLVEALNGTPSQVEMAAEIGMEHNLGLTCDPIGGLVQIPCIERNAMGSIKAINAARIALKSDGTHFVSLDSVIRTMRATGADMKSIYKETSRGGLAVNVTEC